MNQAERIGLEKVTSCIHGVVSQKADQVLTRPISQNTALQEEDFRPYPKRNVVFYRNRLHDFLKPLILR